MPLKSRIPEIVVEMQAKMEVVARGGAKTIEQGAKARVPVDTGDLRDAIHTEEEIAGSYVIAGDDGAEFYGHIIENGSVKMPPRPFLIPAFEAAREPIIAAAHRVLRGL